MIKADLHTHTTASDGTFSPSDLVQLAQKQNIKYLAITDHDTTEGINEAVEEAVKHGIEIIPGIELSLNYPGVPGSIHLLGLYIDYQSEAIQNYVSHLKEYRKERNLKMLSKLQKMHFDISAEDFPEVSLYNLGRAHIARKMVEKGYCKTINHAFEKYLKKNGKAYVNKKRYSVEEGIDMIHSLSGIASLAHPYTLKLNNTQLDVFIKYLKEAIGLDGLEVFYPEHSPRFVEFYYELCQKYQLIATGGSDFHGENKPDNQLGCGFINPDAPIKMDFQSTIKQLEERHEYYAKSLS